MEPVLYLFVQTSTPVHWRRGQTFKPGLLCTPIQNAGYIQPGTPQWQHVREQAFMLMPGQCTTMGVAQFVESVDQELYYHIFMTKADIQKVKQQKKTPISPLDPAVTGHGGGCKCPNCLELAKLQGAKQEKQPTKNKTGHSPGCTCEKCAPKE